MGEYNSCVVCLCCVVRCVLCAVCCVVVVVVVNLYFTSLVKKYTMDIT